MTTQLHPLANPHHPLMALQLGNYNVLINPNTLTDINIPHGLQLAIGTPSGQILSSTGAAAEQLLVEPPPDAPESDATQAQLLSGRDRRGNWAAVVTEPVAYLRGPLATARLQVVPVGVALALFLVSLVICGCRGGGCRRWRGWKMPCNAASSSCTTNRSSR